MIKPGIRPNCFTAAGRAMIPAPTMVLERLKTAPENDAPSNPTSRGSWWSYFSGSRDFLGLRRYFLSAATIIVIYRRDWISPPFSGNLEKISRVAGAFVLKWILSSYRDINAGTNVAWGCRWRSQWAVPICTNWTRVGPAALASIQRFSLVRYWFAEPFRQRTDGELLRYMPVTGSKRKTNEDRTPTHQLPESPLCSTSLSKMAINPF